VGGEPFFGQARRFRVAALARAAALARVAAPSLAVFCRRSHGTAGDVAQAHGLQQRGGQPLPTGRRVDLLGQPASVGDVAADALTDALDALVAEHEPQLEGAKAAAQRDAPVAQVADEAVLRGAQIARVGAHHAHEVVWVAHVVRAEVEAGAHPLVRVEDERVGAFDAVPHPAELGAHHRGSGEGGVDVQPQCVALGDLRQAAERVERRGRRGADRRHEGARPAPRGEVGGDRLLERVWAQGVLVVRLDQPQVLGAEPRQQGALLHGRVRLVRRVHDERRIFRLEAAPVLAEVGGPLAGAEQGAERR